MPQSAFESPVMATAVRRLLRSQMAAKGIEYKDLANRLKELGVDQRESTLRSKINNGTLGAQLFVYIQLALGVRDLHLSQVNEILQDVRRERDLQSEQTE
ncbi:MAG: DUF6471 domain-containing protein [Gammaproteobacteria bacterium]|nr:DUF6471 domain-containing protein [Gammaproteobacteria bacterium]